MEKEGKNKSQHLGFLSHNILGQSQCVYKFEHSDSHRRQDSAFWFSFPQCAWTCTLNVYTKFQDFGFHNNREIFHQIFIREKKDK